MKGKVAALVVLVLVAVALYLLRDVYREYETRPWTRDGQVQAELVPVTAPLDAPVRRVLVRSNQAVRAGDVLLELDGSGVEAERKAACLALELADAQEAEARLHFQELARREKGGQGASRPASVSEMVALARAAWHTATLRQQQARLALEQAQARCALTEIRAPVDGLVTPFGVRPGVRLQAGQTLFHIIDRNSFRISAFFRESVLAAIQPGMEAQVTLMAWPKILLHGHVESIDGGIFRQDGESGPNGLPVVSPTFDWIRLAQRIPVNIRLDGGCELPLRVGMTASVQILLPEKARKLSQE